MLFVPYLGQHYQPAHLLLERTDLRALHLPPLPLRPPKHPLHLHQVQLQDLSERPKYLLDGVENGDRGGDAREEKGRGEVADEPGKLYVEVVAGLDGQQGRQLLSDSVRLHQLICQSRTQDKQLILNMTCIQQSHLLSLERFSPLLLSNALDYSSLFSLIQANSTFSLTYLLQFYPSLLPALLFTLLFLALSGACLAQAFCCSQRQCCKDKVYSVREISCCSLSLVTVNLLLSVMLVGGLILSEEGERGFRNGLCRLQKELQAIYKGNYSMDSGQLSLNHYDIPAQIKSLKALHDNLVAPVSAPYLTSFPIPSTLLLRNYLNSICANVTVASPSNGSALNFSPMQDSCKKLQEQLAQWENSLKSLQNINSLFGINKPMSVLYRSSLSNYLNSYYLGSVPSANNLAKAAFKYRDSLRTFSSNHYQLYFTYAYSASLAVSVFVVLITWLSILPPFLLYQHRLVKCLKIVWLITLFSTLLLLLISLGLTAVAMINGQFAKGIDSIRTQPNNFKDYLPNSFLTCMASPNGYLFSALPPFTFDYSDIFAKAAQYNSKLNLKKSNASRQALRIVLDLLSHPEKVPGSGAGAVFQQIKKCSNSNGSNLNYYSCKGIDLAFVFNPLDCDYRLLQVTTPVTAPNVCVKIKSVYSVPCQFCFVEPTYPSGSSYATVVAGALGQMAEDSCQFCKEQIKKRLPLLEQYGGEISQKLNAKAKELIKYIKQYQEDFDKVRLAFNLNWETSYAQLIPRLLVFSEGNKCLNYANRISRIANHLSTIALYTLMEAVLFGVIGLMFSLSGLLLFNMTSRLELYSKKQGYGQVTIQKQQKKARLDLDWQKILQLERKEEEERLLGKKPLEMRVQMTARQQPVTDRANLS